VSFIKKYFALCLGFGLSMTFLFSIPIVSVFALPAAVVGGTLLVGIPQKSKSHPSR
jgi:uncharacterized protein involved in cysteine biosynthesis